MPTRSRFAVIIAALGLGIFACFAQSRFPEKYTPVRDYHEQSIWELPDIAEADIDVGLWALIIAKEIDSEVDVDTNLQLLDDMAAEVKRMLAGRTRDIEKVSMTRTFLYESGIWNGERPFSYDLDDPMGMKIENKLLSSYLVSRKGNCLSMPLLFIALMERIDPDVSFHAVKAPLHLFCRLHDRQTGDVWNIEATNGGHPARNQWYIETMDIPQKAIDSGLYLKDLTKKELLADLVHPLVSKYRFEEDYEKAMTYADLILQIFPTSYVGLVSKGALEAWLGHNIVQKAKTENRPLTEAEKSKVEKHASASRKYIETARAMGWQPETEAQQQSYLLTIREQKAKLEMQSTHSSSNE